MIIVREELLTATQKIIQFNERQTKACTPLKTLNGSVIKYGSYGLGKQMATKHYFHGQYGREMIPNFNDYVSILQDILPDFEFNCLCMDHSKKDILRFDFSPEFDTAREPGIKEFAYVSLSEQSAVRKPAGKSIWHHKWLWVDPSYKGFDVKEAWEWSKLWLSTLNETANGSSIDAWNKQMDKYGLPRDE